MSALRIPSATYRIQFNQSFRFADARDLVPYLHELGVSDLYASPRFKARRGSSHGYDVANPLRINSELGTNEEFDELCEKLHSYGMGLLLDIVPNHMAASPENPWWLDVLENGSCSVYAPFFDIDWHPATSKAAFLQDDKVLLPTLGDLYGNVLENQELILKLDEQGFYIRLYDARLPLDPKSYGVVLEHAAALVLEDPGSAEQSAALQQLIENANRLPARSETVGDRLAQRLQGVEDLKKRLWQLYLGNPAIKKRIDEAVRIFNGIKGDPASYDRLDALLDVQAFRVASWKIGNEEINYRRFFDINDLVGLRVELPEVFEARHDQIIELIREGKVSGLRVDHIDGLEVPLDYLRRLQDAADSSPSKGEGPVSLYVVVEKILGRDETLPLEWPVYGTTGYDFLNALNGIFVDPAGLRKLEESYAGFTRIGTPFAELCYAGNKLVLHELFAGDLNALSHHLGKIAARDRRARDIPMSELRQLIIEVTARLPVYRTYIRAPEVSEQDRRVLTRALEAARSRTSEERISSAAFSFLRKVFLLETADPDRDPRQLWLAFTRRWQQLTGAVMAKGLEDTASYIHNSLLSLNEVGGDPLREKPPFDRNEFHEFNSARLRHWPHTMNATSTHDTKRSEDVRARINVLSEISDTWGTTLSRWSRWNKPKKQSVEELQVPAPAEESMIYQTLVGAWPFESAEIAEFQKRMTTFVVKAAREAKVHTSWLRPDEKYENALTAFVDSIFESSDRFMREFLRFQRKIAYFGALNSLAQVLLKITSPGVPDFYQGTELWNLRLVDPDNRLAVDFQERIRHLEEVKRQEAVNHGRLLSRLLSRWQDGRVKLFLTYKALDYRRAHALLFQQGEYLPLTLRGARRENACAFVRRHADEWALVAVPCRVTQLAAAGVKPLGSASWEDTAIDLPEGAPRSWSNVLTKEVVSNSEGVFPAALSLQEVFSRFPVALMHGEAGKREN